MTLGIMCHSLMAQLHCKGTLRRIRMHASSCLAVSVPHIASARGMCLHNFEVPSTLTHHPCPTNRVGMEHCNPGCTKYRDWEQLPWKRRQSGLASMPLQSMPPPRWETPESFPLPTLAVRAQLKRVHCRR